MPPRRSPVLSLLLALALVAYPATMPVAMAGQAAAAAHGGQRCDTMHHPAGHHHAAAGCCLGVCASCPVLAVRAEPGPGLESAVTLVVHSVETPAPAEPSELHRLPFSIGPPARRA